MFIKLIMLFFTFHFQVEASCDCEKIKQTRECDNPDCITICGLENVVESLNSALLEKCLPGKEKTVVFTKNKLSIMGVPNFFKNIKNKIKEIEEKDSKDLEEKCPHCDLFPELKNRFPIQSSKKVCPEKYIKEHTYKKRIDLKMENSKCNKDRLVKKLETQVKSILKKNASKEAKQLWTACPDPCSFDTSYSIRINEMDCVGDIDLRVLCTNPHRGLFGPIYSNVSVEYKRGLQCKK